MNEVALAPSPSRTEQAPAAKPAAKAAPKVAEPARETKEPREPREPPGEHSSEAPKLSQAFDKIKQDDRTGRYLMIATAIGVVLSVVFSRVIKRPDGKPLYTAGDDFGYYIGLVGGVMMLTLLTYPLRKYLQSFRNWGPVRHWFSVHMYLGLLGPVLVLAHSTYHLKSTNATVALICTVIVAASGIVGRFIYVRIHRGLSGEKVNFEELKSAAGFETDEMHSKLHFVPEVERRLTEFQSYSLANNLGFSNEALRLFTLGTRRRIVFQVCAAELRQVMRERAAIRHWDRDKYRRRLGRATRLVNEFLISVQRVSQFSIFERLFRLWHIAHVPLVYLLVLSAVAHVVAVHMY